MCIKKLLSQQKTNLYSEHFLVAFACFCTAHRIAVLSNFDFFLMVVFWSQFFCMAIKIILSFPEASIGFVQVIQMALGDKCWVVSSSNTFIVYLLAVLDPKCKV